MNTKFYEGFEKRLGVYDRGEERLICDNYDKETGGYYSHCAIYKDVEIIVGKNCAKCKSIEKLVEKYGLEDYFKFVPVEDELEWVKSHNYATVPILKLTTFDSDNVGSIVGFVKWLKDNI